MAPQKPCHYFQLGNCTRGNQCTYAHVTDPNFKRRPCHQYFATGVCKKGSKCIYSHDGSATTDLNGSEAQPQNAPNTTEAQFKEWRYKIPLESHKARRLGPGMTRFYQQALELVGGEPGVMQAVITLLASNGGLVRISELLDQPFQELSDAQLGRVFNAQLLPFFKIITHKNVSASPILESHIMTICNYIFGHDGQRAVQVFQSVAKYLSNLNLSSSDDGTPDHVTTTAFEYSLAAFSKTIQVNTTAQVHEGLIPIVEKIATLLQNPPSDAVVYAIRNTQKHLLRLEQRMGLGKALFASKTQTQDLSQRPTFTLAREMPGQLSEEGPRHDNDNVDIREISILPTLQEIQSSRFEYLPHADPREWHLDGLEGLLDRNFRLLREDTVGQLRDAAKSELELLQNPSTRTKQQKRQGARTYVYDHVSITDTVFDSSTGLEFALSFGQPMFLKSKTSAQRHEWWQGSKRMGFDALICLLSSDGAATFLVVSPEPRKPNPKEEEFTAAKSVSLHKEYNLWSDSERAYVIAHIIKQEDIRPAIDQFLNASDTTFSLVEFPGIILPAFMPTLQAMQRLSTSLDVPFAHILAPVAMSGGQNESSDVGVPQYAHKPGFKFDLTSLSNDGTQLHFEPDEPADEIALNLALHSSLDSGQAEAIVWSLSHSLALIQGPPGTGKSYTGVQLIRALLANKAAAELGPLLCVTFTNHALDQGLERLVDEGVSQIIRIGGRSKSERLIDLNLRAAAQHIDLTKTEKKQRWDMQKKVDYETKEINRILGLLSQKPNQAQIRAYLQAYHPEHYDQLFSRTDEEGFTLVGYSADSIIYSWLRSAPMMYVHIFERSRAIEDLYDVPVHYMSRTERVTLYHTWLTEITGQLQERLEIALNSYNESKKELDLIRTEVDLRVLRQANIIGITTSGLARNIDLLQRTNAKVLICEEAGEVLEAHLLTALLPSIEHAILIGDQQQLRPHVQNYDLSTESKTGSRFSLDISLFERLVQPNNILSQPLPYCRLEVQRRMHPSISQLVRQTQYPRLQDAPTVSHYPQVSGMRHRLFWMHHEILENDSEDSHSTSHANDHECELTAALVSHLVKQGVYRSNDIAVITPYLGQLRKIRKRLGSSFEIVLNERDTEDLAKESDSSDNEATALPPQRAQIARGTLLQALRVATVDNFQGEEAKVIVISLVRSNKKNNAGFLRTPNRINVLLSRAQHGMYIIGNANTTQHVKMWGDVTDMFKKNTLLGDSLQLCCPRHPDTPMAVKVPEDFLRLSPEAGCDLPCDKRLGCGHACIAKCHSEMLHKAVYCTESCTRPKPGCSHNCPLDCGAVCEKQCQEIVENVRVAPPDCDHEKTSLPCYQYQDPTQIRCDVRVLRTIEACGHQVTLPCHVDVNSENFFCYTACGASLECGHDCKKACHKCRVVEDGEIIKLGHGECTQPCDRNYQTCKHRCRASCHGKEHCPLCEAKCDVRCSHSACDKKCHEPCTPCAEDRCASYCPHSQCNMPCAAPCDWLPCSKRCSKLLGCGCQCPSVCGDVCPDAKFCQNCASDDIKALEVDMIMFEVYGDINLDEDPCIFTECGHVFTLSSMDGIMGMNKHYKVDSNTGTCVSIISSSEPFSSDDLKSCPTCRGSLRLLARYGRIVRRAMLDESTKKLTVWSNRTHQSLADRLLSEQERLLGSLDTTTKPIQRVRFGGSIDEQLRTVRDLKTSHRYRRIFGGRRSIEHFVDTLRTEEHPYQRVRDLVETVRRQQSEPGIDAFDFASTELQLREHLQATSLLIRCDTVIFTDIINVHMKTPSTLNNGVLKIDFGANRDHCEMLIKEAEKTVNVRQEAEGRIFWARYAAMEVGTLETIEEDIAPGTLHLHDILKDTAFGHLENARKACETLGGIPEDLASEVAETRRMLQEGTSASEMRMVVGAMAAEFNGSGHWYRCPNGHPFTVGGCGMPMELARCPACGSSVGGQHHRPTEGVTYADDIETQFLGLNLGG